MKSHLALMADLALKSVSNAMEELQGPQYVVHGAITACSCGLRENHVVIPESHGVYIHGLPQLTVADNEPTINIQTFGGCTSPENRSVRDAAEKIVEEVQQQPKSFTEKIIGIFFKPKAEADESFVSTCAGQCTPVFARPWENGKDIVEIDGHPALLDTGILNCIYNGQVSIVHPGQPE